MNGLGHTDRLILEALVAHDASEPRVPDPDSARYTEVAKAHERWADERYGYVLLLGSRLVRAALDGRLP